MACPYPSTPSLPTWYPYLPQVHVLCALPLRNMSRIWGYLNSFELPIWIRPYGFRLYAYMFGRNLDETELSNLTRCQIWRILLSKIEPGVRPVDNSVLVSVETFLSSLQCLITAKQVSPADGTAFHISTIDSLRVEQVKDMTYSLDVLLGVETSRLGRPTSPTYTIVEFPRRHMAIVDDHEFAMTTL